MLTINNTLDGYLKDVEIKGNTIQDASNLADIRSVGDTVEGQELYEIPVLSCGKNLFSIDKLINDLKIHSHITTTKIDNDTFKIALNVSVSDTIIFKGLFKENTRYTFSKQSYITPSDYDQAFFTIEYTDGSSEPIYAGVASKVSAVGKSISHLGISKGSGKCETTYTGYIIEEGTVATPYEPYIEDKLTILSPVQLEKVGDVADRLIEKDGVWGVEKNITHSILNGTNCNIKKSGKNGFTNVVRFWISSTDNPNMNIAAYKSVVCDKLKSCGTDNSNIDEESIANSNGFDIHISKSKLESEDVNGLNKYLKLNNMLLIYPTTNPTFIPLPHDQQVKLRTFANKTNISFGCEIEGTIKAQVPKSLGATVNTHTEQINNLNKELDRVKKLEESTVSTVTTESDFTTVEATSNGYFEDVKLEGKTLVNVGNSKLKLNYNSQGNALFEGNNIKLQNAGVGANAYIENCVFKPSTLYTLIVNCIDTTLSTKHFQISNWDTVVDTTINIQITKGINIYTFITSSNVDTQRFMISVSGSSSQNEYVLIDKNILLLEGDHTQNPPSFFEGLKSVGQSATTSETDEIVVESIDNINLFDSRIETQKINGVTFSYDNTTNEIVLNGSATVDNTCFIFEHAPTIISGSKYYLRIFNSAPNNPRASIRVFDENYTGFTANTQDTNISEYTSSSTRKMINTSIRVDKGSVFNNFRFKVQLTKDEDYPTYIGKQDKKRLLYYNEETQTWEKPILRQWDSVEKHADGKYYYHQRSGEVVLNGSENWRTYYDTGVVSFMELQCFAKNNSYIYSDRFSTSDVDLYKKDIEGIFVNAIGTIQLTILNSKLPTQNVQGFKQWLQANNVTVVYQLAEEKVYECTNIDLITYANETNYVVESGAIVPRTTLKVHNNISNVVSLLQKKVSLLESNVTSYMITQNRLMLASRYNADTVSFKVDVATLRNSFEYDNDLYELILNNILVGKDNYNREYIENLIIFYWMDFVISDEMYLTLFEIIEEQHNPKVIEEETPLI